MAKFVYMFGECFEDPALEVPTGILRLSHIPMICFEYSRRRLEYAKGIFPQSMYYINGDEVYDNIIAHLENSAKLGVNLINLSLAPDPRTGRNSDPVLFAIEFLAQTGCIVVVAAGNSGPSHCSTTQWCRSPWTIGVGATDEAGTQLLKYSSVGERDSNTLGPTVVANGNVRVWQRPEYRGEKGHGTAVSLILRGQEDIPFDGGELWESSGTSFSAPRIQKICGILLIIEELVLEVGECLSKGAEYFADSSYNTSLKVLMQNLVVGEERHRFSILRNETILGVASAWVSLERSRKDPFKSFSLALPLKRVESLLRHFARPMDGYDEYQVGAGFISDQVFIAGLMKVSASTYFKAIFGVEIEYKIEQPLINMDLLNVALARFGKKLRTIDAKVL